MAAGKLSKRVQFERQGEGVSNGMGGKVAPWETIGPETFVEITAAAGAETVLAGRLASRDPAEVDIRSTPLTLTLSPPDRMRELDGLRRVWNLKSVRESKRKGYLTFTVETGLAGS